jgi:hypothetical protein
MILLILTHVHLDRMACTVTDATEEFDYERIKNLYRVHAHKR